tara:strand:- start:272 stop:433 length:162 start_codon:yes stop_codon:yes gene_type:complete
MNKFFTIFIITILLVGCGGGGYGGSGGNSGNNPYGSTPTGSFAGQVDPVQATD